MRQAPSRPGDFDTGHLFAGRARPQCRGIPGCRTRAVESPTVSTSVSRVGAGPGEQAVTAERCAAQLLCGEPARSAEEVAWRLLAIQAQDPRGARLTFRARSAGLSASDVDAALASRSMIISWLNRGTLHLVRTEDYWWLHPLTAPQVGTGNARRLAQEGVPPGDAERAVATVRAALAADGPLIRSQLRERVAAPGCGPKARRWCTSWCSPASAG